MKTLDCGHQPSPHSEHTTGTAHTTDGREICWTCADAEQREQLRTADTFTAYLTPVLTAEGHTKGHALTTWTGGHLATVTVLTCGRHNIGGQLYRFRAVDVHGAQWYGTSPGPQMYARMRKAKVRS
jgi:hypothetical protein